MTLSHGAMLLKMPEQKFLQHDRKQNRVISIVARLSRGNILLQSAHYQTVDQMNARVAKLKDYRFDE